MVCMCVYPIVPCMGLALGPIPAQCMAHRPGWVKTNGLTLARVGPGLSLHWTGSGLGSISGSYSGHRPGMGCIMMCLGGAWAELCYAKKNMNGSIKIKPF